MSWRSVIISRRSKLDYKMGYLVIRGEDTKRVCLDEIAILVLENPAVSLTGCLMEALMEKKVRVIFCDSKRLPVSEVVPYHGSHNSSLKVRQQSAWTHEYNLIMLENCEHARQECEERLIIDGDLCEIG